MKKVLLVAAAVMFALCSCGKTDLTEQIPQLKGSWQWRQTIVGGFVGVINPDVEKEIVLTFGDDNRLSISLNGEIVVSGETYSCKKTNGNEYGDYMQYKITTYSEDETIETDVVVVGLGLTGVTASMSALDRWLYPFRSKLHE